MTRILMIFSFLLFACHHQVKPPVMAASISWDSTGHAAISDSSGIDIRPPCPSIDSLVGIISANKNEKDSLKTELFLSQFAVTRVRYYLNICLKNPKQDKFLKGWIKRAIQ